MKGSAVVAPAGLDTPARAAVARGRRLGWGLSARLPRWRAFDGRRSRVAVKWTQPTTEAQMKTIQAFAMALLSATLFGACTRDAQAMDAQQIERQYGVAGGYTGSVQTADGSMKGTLVPITLANGRQGQLFIPEKRANVSHTVYIRDEQGLHPVQLRDNVSRAELARSPAIVETRPAPQQAKKRSWEKEALIIGGSAGAGTAIGALAGGKKGAAIGAATGGVGGLIYDLVTRNKKPGTQ
jgi:hypothetical protein